MEREHIGVAALPAHKAALRRLAAANGESMAVVVRRLIREEAQRCGCWPPTGMSEIGEANERAREPQHG
jgi:hypothetical protein